MQDEQMVAWLLEAQIIIAGACGVGLTVADLGAPKGGDGVGAHLAHLQNASPPPPRPPPPQFQQQQFQPPSPPPPQFQQQQDHRQLREPLPYGTHQHGPEPTDLRGNPIRLPRAVAPQPGVPLRPDQENDSARDAIRKRNMGSFAFG